MQTIHLPMPPSTNTYYRHVGNMVKISAAGRDYRETVVKEVEAQQVEAYGQRRIALHALIERADNRRADLDNFGGKGLLDSLTHAGVYDDDGQIDLLIVERGAKSKRPGCVVSLWELPAKPWYESVLDAVRAATRAGVRAVAHWNDDALAAFMSRADGAVDATAGHA